MGALPRDSWRRPSTKLWNEGNGLHIVSFGKAVPGSKADSRQSKQEPDEQER